MIIVPIKDAGVYMAYQHRSPHPNDTRSYAGQGSTRSEAIESCIRMMQSDVYPGVIESLRKPIHA